MASNETVQFAGDIKAMAQALSTGVKEIEKIIQAMTGLKKNTDGMTGVLETFVLKNKDLMKVLPSLRTQYKDLRKEVKSLGIDDEQLIKIIRQTLVQRKNEIKITEKARIAKEKEDETVRKILTRSKTRVEQAREIIRTKDAEIKADKKHQDSLDKQSKALKNLKQEAREYGVRLSELTGYKQAKMQVDKGESSGIVKLNKRLKEEVASRKKLANAISSNRNRLADLLRESKKYGVDIKKIKGINVAWQKALGGDARALKKVETALKNVKTHLNTHSKHLNKTVRNHRNLHMSMNKTAGTLSVLRSKLLVYAFAARMVEQTVVNMVKTYGEQNAAELKVRQTLTQTGHAAGITYGEIQKLTKSLQENGVIGDEVNLQMSAVMLTYDKIGKTVFPRALKAANDMATTLALGIPTTEQLQSTITMLSKSLQDPVRGMNALRRVGFSLNEEQQEQIKTHMALGETIEAQNLILEAAEKQYGNMAKIIKDSTIGQMNTLSLAWGDASETLGKGFLPIVKLTTEKLTTLANIIERNPVAIRGFTSALLKLTTALLAIKVLSGAVAKQQAVLAAAHLGVAWAIKEQKNATILLGVAQKAIKLASWTGLVLIAYDAIQMLTGGFKDSADEARRAADAQFDLLETAQALSDIKLVEELENTTKALKSQASVSRGLRKEIKDINKLTVEELAAIIERNKGVVTGMNIKGQALLLLKEELKATGALTHEKLILLKALEDEDEKRQTLAGVAYDKKVSDLTEKYVNQLAVMNGMSKERQEEIQITKALGIEVDDLSKVKFEALVTAYKAVIAKQEELTNEQTKYKTELIKMKTALTDAGQTEVDIINATAEIKQKAVDKEVAAKQILTAADEKYFIAKREAIVEETRLALIKQKLAQTGMQSSTDALTAKVVKEGDYIDALKISYDLAVEHLALEEEKMEAVRTLSDIEKAYFIAKKKNLDDEYELSKKLRENEQQAKIAGIKNSIELLELSRAGSQEYSNKELEMKKEQYELERMALIAKHEWTEKMETEHNARMELIGIEHADVELARQQATEDQVQAFMNTQLNAVIAHNEAVLSANFNAEMTELKNSRKYQRMSDKRRKEEEAAVRNDFNKKAEGLYRAKQGIAIGNIIIDYLQAKAAGFAQLGPIFGISASTVMASLSAASVAAVLATPPPQKFAKGGEFITSGAEQIIVGEAGREHVQITPIDRPADRALGSGGSINISFSGNVMSNDFIENEAIPQIKEAIRRGADIGIA